MPRPPRLDPGALRCRLAGARHGQRALGRRGAGLALVAIGLVACGPAVGRPAPVASPRRSAAPAGVASRLGQATATASRFLELAEQGAYGRQWALLAPLARAQWPSAAGRARMLRTKFQGAARIVGFTLGGPRPGARWVSRENPAQVAGGGVGIAVRVRFLDPAALRPVGVAADFRSLELIVTPATARGPARVLGEGPLALDAPVVTPTVVALRTAAVPILMYHLVGPLPIRSQWTAKYDGAYGYAIEYGLTVPTAQFAAEMGALVAAHDTAISLTHLLDGLLYGLRLPPRPVVITFDDGFQDEFQYAVPILLRDHLTAVFLPCSGFIGAVNGPQRYMSAHDLVQLVADGFSVEDHTIYDSVKLWGVGPQLMDQLAGSSAARLERITGQPIQFISYSGLWPFASSTEVQPPEAELFSELARLGYVGGLEDNQLNGSPWFESSRQPFLLPRLRCYPGESPAAFATIVEQG